MLTLFLIFLNAGSPALAPAAAAPQERPAAAAAVAVRGDAELSAAEALASARRRAEEHVRAVWRERAEREAALRRPGWLPVALTERAVDRWVAELPVERLFDEVDRDQRERAHEFGRSYQTTLWVTEPAARAGAVRRELRSVLRGSERAAALKAGAVVAGWLALGLLLSWVDRLSRGYMTGRLCALGALGAASLPAVLFLL